MRTYKIIIGLFFTSLIGCVKPYDFDPQSFEKVLVIDGLITDQPGPYPVQITYTYPLDTAFSEFVTEAEVWVVDENGNRIDYTQQEGGTYLSPAGFTGQVGSSYQLYVQMPDGSTYASVREPLIASPEIDRIYGRYAELPTPEGDRNVGGIQFFIDSQDETGNARYFRYEWEEGFKIVVPLPKAYIANEDSSLTWIPFEEQIRACYKENASNNLIYGTTVGSAGNRMAEFPVRFVSQEEQTLRERYAILVKQYAISESAYLFYKRLRENNESGGSLFDQQTGSVFGNISSVNDINQAVLGYFEVSGVAEKRTFFDHEELDPKLDVADFPFNCLMDRGVITTPDSVLYYLAQTGGNVFGMSTFPPEVYIHQKGCTECAYYANPIPPDYWID